MQLCPSNQSNQISNKAFTISSLPTLSKTSKQQESPSQPAKQAHCRNTTKSHTTATNNTTSTLTLITNHTSYITKTTTHAPRIHGFRLHGLLDLVDGGAAVPSQPLLLLLLQQMPLHVLHPLLLVVVRWPSLERVMILVQARVLVQVRVLARVRIETTAPKPHPGRVPRSIVVVVIHLTDSKP